MMHARGFRKLGFWAARGAIFQPPPRTHSQVLLLLFAYYHCCTIASKVRKKSKRVLGAVAAAAGFNFEWDLINALPIVHPSAQVRRQFNGKDTH